MLLGDLGNIESMNRVLKCLGTCGDILRLSSSQKHDVHYQMCKVFIIVSKINAKALAQGNRNVIPRSLMLKLLTSARQPDFKSVDIMKIMSSQLNIGGGSTGNYGFDGYMAEIVYNDGQSYGPENYGESKNGAWIPKDPSGLTFGNQGFYLKFGNASDLGEDSSGNDNDFTVANVAAADVSIDTPTIGTGS